MKNKITTIIILISIVLLLFAMFYGVKIGNFAILSISQLKEKNADLNKKIDKASELAKVDYVNNTRTLEETYNQYKIQKQKYEQLVDEKDEKNDKIYETKQYDIGYLWRVLGKYAEKRKLNLGIDVQKAIASKSSYNINFEVLGNYPNISKFITDIENDSDLYFRIYNFKMTGDSEKVKSTFTVRDINIDPETIIENAQIPEDDF